VTFNGLSAGNPYGWTASNILATVPNGAMTGNVVVTVNGVASNGVLFTVSVPSSIVSVSPSSGSAGVQVTVSGSGFGSAQGTGTVWLGTALGAVVSWSDTQIVATVASNATSGNVQVQQGGAWSNAVPFTVSTAAISSVTPSSGVPGTVVTVAGSGFGAAQGSGQVWLGTVPGVVQSWSDAQVVAVVATGAATGNASVLQNGVISNAVPFTVNSLRLTSVSPNSGVAGTSVTFTGAGFGASQGSGEAWLGGMDGQVVSWNDTQIVAAVATGALTGIARVQQNGAWSNAVAFTVPGAGGLQLEPVLINMEVGDTHPMQAVSAAGQRVSGLTWASSDPTVASLSTDDPPVLTAVAAGHVTITAGAASADVTVWASEMPVGTVLWMNAGIGASAGGAQTVPQAFKAGGARGALGSPRGRFGAIPRPARRRARPTLSSNPADESDVTSIVPAVPSPSGAADVFAFQSYADTVQAITADGTTAWTADLEQGTTCWVGPWEWMPDFQGGLVGVTNTQIPTGQCWSSGLVGLDGMTGQPKFTYNPPDALVMGVAAVHPDGTVFATQQSLSAGYSDAALSVVGVDPTTGAQKFSVLIDHSDEAEDFKTYTPLIAGDGYAYFPYQYSECCNPGITAHIRLLRVDSSGNSDSIPIVDLPPTQYRGYWFDGLDVSAITNADQGVVLTWTADPNAQDDPLSGPPDPVTYGIAVTTGASARVMSTHGTLNPVLQAQDGSFIGTRWSDSEQNLIAFDQGGNVRWLAPGNWQPQIATADGGVIAINQDTGAAVTFDQNGNAAGQVGSLPDYSWKGAYEDGLVESVVPAIQLAGTLARSFAAVPGGNLTGNGFYLSHHTFGLVFCGSNSGDDGSCPSKPGVASVTFSYLSNIGDDNYLQAADFSQAYPSWINTIKWQAYNQYKAAFDHLPAIVDPKETLMELHGGWSKPKSFEHTVYITGQWVLPDMYPRNIAKGAIPTGNTPSSIFDAQNCDAKTLICAYSVVYYLPIMGNAQWALGTQPAHGDFIPLSPPYSPPPMDPATAAQFNTLLGGIGYGIATVSAHETGHQLALPDMECGIEGNPGCPEDYIYQNGGSGSNHEWFYKSIPGKQIHWSHDAKCAIGRYLLGASAAIKGCP
jgi:hypothetical protein